MKSNTQNAKIEAITEKTLVLGIDVGSEMHYARAFDYRGIEYSKKPFKFSNTEAGFATFKEWIRDLKERHEKDKVVPGMEPTGHYWFNLGKFLQDNEMKPVLVNPHHVKKTKELDDNNPTGSFFVLLITDLLPVPALCSVDVICYILLDSVAVHMTASTIVTFLLISKLPVF